MTRHDEVDPLEPFTHWPRQVQAPEKATTGAARLTRALRFVRLLLLTLATLAAVLSFATALAGLPLP
ncbi:hypothetical protein [Streptomyces sp. NPDC054887]